MVGPNFVQERVSVFIRQTNSLSPSLLLSKYAQVGEERRKDHKGKEIRVPFKPEAVRAVCRATPGRPLATKPWTNRADAHVLYMTLKSRLLINMAGGILENANICLHPFTSQPFIPGSAVKGVTRHAAWRMWNEEEDQILKRSMATAIANIFGFPTGDPNGLDDYLIRECGFEGAVTDLAGSVVFLDAHPADSAKLVEEILAPHKGENVTPIVFPSVESGATFIFTLLPARRFTAFDPEIREQYWTLVQSWLREALTQDGLGAKTSAGYGWFEENNDLADREKAQAETSRRAEAGKKAEAVRQASLSPVDRHKEEFLSMGQEPFALAAKALADFEADRQKAFLEVVADPSKKEWWKAKKKNAKKFPKDAEVVNTMLALAPKHGVNLQ